MPKKTTLIGALIAGLTLAGCSTTPSLPTSTITTNALPVEKPGKPVVAARATRMYVWASFLEKDCSAAQPTITISKQPAKGQITLKENETTYIQHSSSGKCVGQSLPGTGIYYTAQKGQSGDDSFALTATSRSGQVATRTFKVNIID